MESEFARVPLVAILEAPSATRAVELTSAGFGAILVKPVAYDDIEKFLQA